MGWLKSDEDASPSKHGEISNEKMYDMLYALLDLRYGRAEDGWGVVHGLELFDATEEPAKVWCVHHVD